MFVSSEPGAALRVIDFGSACIDADNTKGHAEGHHRTFAGSAFYGSPEMFAKAYNAKTDVWSVGVCLYVILAGYPATQLQQAFQLLHKANRNLRDLPGMPLDVPDTMVDLLHQALTYRYKQRPTAETLLHHDFVVFHQTVQATTTKNDAAVASTNTSTPTRPSLRVEPSIRLTGNRSRHNQQLGFQTYERSLTTLLATMLSKTDLAQLLVILSNQDNADPTLSSSKAGAKPEQTLDNTQEKLIVVPVRQLQDVIRKEFPQQGKDVVAAMQALPSAAEYQDFPYPIDLLREFTSSTTTALPRNGAIAAKAPARPGIKSSFSMRPSRVAMK